MEQLGLDLTPRLSYSSSLFVPHHGVSDVISGLDLLTQKNIFSSGIVFGKSRYGKTHLSVHIVDRCLEIKRFPRIVDHEEFIQLLDSIQREGLRGEGVIIVDDIDKYLKSIHPGQSGPFVNFWEFLRQRDIHLILLMSTPIEDLPCDAHVKSRLNSASKFTIDTPDENDLEQLVRSLASQRGIRLGGRKVSFLKKRIRRDIPSLEHYFERLIHLTRLFGEKMKFHMLEDAL